jgi:hypothetical protein
VRRFALHREMVSRITSVDGIEAAERLVEITSSTWMVPRICTFWPCSSPALLVEPVAEAVLGQQQFARLVGGGAVHA